jgi:signal transduction histidine kinase
LAGALAGEALQAADERLEPERDGRAEEAYCTFSYSPVADDDGASGGVLETVEETTARVLAERRLATLAAMETRAASAQDVCERAARALAGNALDVPFALFYVLDETHLRAHLSAATGLEPGTFAAPHVLRLGSASWPLARALREPGALLVDDLGDRLMGLAAGPWPDAPRAALLLPLAVAGEPPAGVLVAGLSPRRPLDEPYRAFLELVAGQVAAGVAAVRTAERDRERLASLAALDGAKTEFFANVSHEFRTPLARVLASLEGALRDRDALPAAVAGELEIAGRNGRRLLALVDQLLDFSRAQAGRLDADHERADLAAETVEVAALFQTAAERAGLRLEIDCPPLDELVWVDREMWQVILANLVSNALKFTFAGEVVVTLRALPRHAEVTVRDTGVGIPPGELPHVFERFHRVQGRRARTQEGAGLGLALVHELVGLHHGRVHMRSALGEGTTVSVWIPLGARLGAADAPEGGPPAPCAVAVALAEAAAGWGA